MSHKIGLITGTRKGLGRALAEHYLEKSYKIYGCSRNQHDWSHPNFTALQADVSAEKDVKFVIDTIRKDAGYLDFIINNAGIASMNHILLTPTNTAVNIFNTNFFGTFLVTREGTRILKKSKSPRIVNFSTVASKLDLEGEAIYASSKTAIESLTRIMAKEFAPMEITVNAIGPTPIDTDLIKGVPKDKITELIKRQAIKRLGEPKDVINVVDFFISNDSNFITGQTIYLGGVF